MDAFMRGFCGDDWGAGALFKAFMRSIHFATFARFLFLPRLCQIKACVCSQSSAIGPLVVGEPVRACSSVG